MKFLNEIYDDLKDFLAEKALWYAIGLFAVAWIGYALYRNKQSNASQDAAALAAVASATAEPYSSTSWGAPLTVFGAAQATTPTTNGLTSTNTPNQTSMTSGAASTSTTTQH